MTSPLATSSSTVPGRKYVELFLISFVILFFQLACIRWFGSTVVFMTFFTNVVLMACFLGMSVGCLATSRRQHFIDMLIPSALVTLILAWAVFWAYSRFGNQIVINVGGQRAPEEIFFGTEYRSGDPSRFVVPIEAVAGLFYVLIAVMFLGLGQEMGRAFNAMPNRVAAYTTNIGGSLAGIAAFGVAAYFHTSPLLWFAISLGIALYFVRSRVPLQAMALVAALVFVGLTSRYGHGRDAQTFWSPYYEVSYEPQNGRISTNNIGHQRMIRVDERGGAYVLPHLLNRDAGGGPFEDVLIIGAGSGNDVQAALSHGARHIDAVEIDPVMYEIGRKDHPNQPYADPRVSIHFDDGRSFVRNTTRQYDLIVYALVDSLVLHSGYSSLRLESFLFTDQAFRDVKAKLKPGGVFVMYNYYRQGWVIGRLEKTATEVFGAKPLVISLPYQETISSENQLGRFTVLFVGNSDPKVVQSIRQRLAETPFWLHGRTRHNEVTTGYGAGPPAVAGTQPQEWEKIAIATVNTAGIDRLPSDDWPFLYLRQATIPVLNVRGMVMIAVLSLAILFLVVPGRTLKLNGQMFFLGAGFMLLETKGVVHLALLFGATWVVNSFVFFSILIMILLSNLFILVFQPKNMLPYYGLLIASLLVNTYVPMSTFLALPGAAKVFASCTVVFVPVFFAGVIFGAAFRDSAQPDMDFGSNIAGVILGGLSEYFSLMVGFDHLLFIAIAFYLASLVFRPRAALAPTVVAG